MQYRAVIKEEPDGDFTVRLSALDCDYRWKPIGSNQWMAYEGTPEQLLAVATAWAQKRLARLEAGLLHKTITIKINEEEKQ